MIENGAAIKNIFGAKHSALQWAAKWRPKEIIQLLIEKYEKNFTMEKSADPFRNVTTAVTVEALENGFNVTEEKGILIYIMTRSKNNTEKDPF